MNRARSVTEELHTLGALLRMSLDGLHDHVFGELARAGFREVRLAHGAVFRHVSREGSRVTTLAERARMTKQSMAELVEYLRKRGYVELVADPTDGRAKLVKLTARGWKVHDALVRLSSAFEKECARSLGEDRWAEFRERLQALAAWSQRHTGKAER
jgi:DNA-binding MarR family transcriptional regulator